MVGPSPQEHVALFAFYPAVHETPHIHSEKKDHNELLGVVKSTGVAEPSVKEAEVGNEKEKRRESTPATTCYGCEYPKGGLNTFKRYASTVSTRQKTKLIFSVFSHPATALTTPVLHQAHQPLKEKAAEVHALWTAISVTILFFRVLQNNNPKP